MKDAKKAIRKIIDDAFKSANGDRAKASELACEAIARRRALRDEIFNACVKGHVWDMIRCHAHIERVAFFVGAPPQEDTKSFESAVVAVAKQRWYQWQLYGGKPLGDATREDLIGAATAWRNLATQNQQRADFVSKIVQRVPAGKKVRDVLSEDQIGRLVATAMKEAA